MLAKNKFLFLVFWVSVTLGSCAQNTKNQENRSAEYRDKIKNIYKEVKTYDYNSSYQLKVNTNLCTYEAYINDIFVDFLFTPRRTAGEQNMDIPQLSLKAASKLIKKLYKLKIKQFKKLK